MPRRSAPLANCLHRPGTVEGPHLPEILAAETSAEALGKIFSQPFDKRIAISSTFSSSLLELDDATTNLPVRGRHRRIDTSRDRPPRSLQQRNNGRLNLAVRFQGGRRQRRDSTSTNCATTSARGRIRPTT